MVELEKEVGVWFRLLQRFQRHPGIQVYSPESAELLWIPFCRSITYRVRSGIRSLDSGIRGPPTDGGGQFNIAQGGDGGSCPLIKKGRRTLYSSRNTVCGDLLLTPGNSMKFHGIPRCQQKVAAHGIPRGIQCAATFFYKGAGSPISPLSNVELPATICWRPPDSRIQAPDSRPYPISNTSAKRNPEQLRGFRGVYLDSRVSLESLEQSKPYADLLFQFDHQTPWHVPGILQTAKS